MGLTLFISDLHLSPANPALNALACDFLSSHQDAETIYILGDIFDTWLGDDLAEPAFDKFTATLQQLSRNGTKIYLMVGNRDFMLGRNYAKRVGSKLLADPTLITLAGSPVLLMHGDRLCTDDEKYQRYRQVVNNRFLQWCFLRLPRRTRQGISDKIKARSAMDKKDKAAGIMDVNQQAVADVMQAFNAEILIHGHTHRPAIHTLESGQHRIVLGDWHREPSFLTFNNGQFELYDARVPENQSILSIL